MWLDRVKTLRYLSVVEGTSYLLILAVGMPLKYALDIGWPNKVMGYLHGVLFVLFCISLLLVGIRLQKGFWWMCIQGVAALIPFGTYVTDIRMLKPLETK